MVSCWTRITFRNTSAFKCLGYKRIRCETRWDIRADVNYPEPLGNRKRTYNSMTYAYATYMIQYVYRMIQNARYNLYTLIHLDRPVSKIIPFLRFAYVYGEKKNTVTSAIILWSPCVTIHYTYRVIRSEFAHFFFFFFLFQLCVFQINYNFYGNCATLTNILSCTLCPPTLRSPVNRKWT